MLTVRQKGNGEGCDLILVCEEQGRQASIRCHSTQQVSMHRKIGRAPVAAFAMTVAVAAPVSGCMRRAIVNACRRAMLSRRCGDRADVVFGQ